MQVGQDNAGGGQLVMNVYTHKEETGLTLVSQLSLPKMSPICFIGVRKLIKTYWNMKR